MPIVNDSSRSRWDAALRQEVAATLDLIQRDGPARSGTSRLLPVAFRFRSAGDASNGEILELSLTVAWRAGKPAGETSRGG